MWFSTLETRSSEFRELVKEEHCLLSVYTDGDGGLGGGYRAARVCVLPNKDWTDAEIEKIIAEYLQQDLNCWKEWTLKSRSVSKYGWISQSREVLTKSQSTRSYYSALAARRGKVPPEILKRIDELASDIHAEPELPEMRWHPETKRPLDYTVGYLLMSESDGVVYRMSQDGWEPYLAPGLPLPDPSVKIFRLLEAWQTRVMRDVLRHGHT